MNKKPLIIKNFLDNNECEKFISKLSENKKYKRAFKGVINENIRNSNYIKLSKKYTSNLFSKISYEIEQHFDVKLSNEITNTYLYEYPEGIGLKEHNDIVDEKEKELAKKNNQPIIEGDFTVVILLNNLKSKNGGELNFTKFNLEIKPENGKLVVFPVEYLHKVNPIPKLINQKNYRYSLVFRCS